MASNQPPPVRPLVNLLAGLFQIRGDLQAQSAQIVFDRAESEVFGEVCVMMHHWRAMKMFRCLLVSYGQFVAECDCRTMDVSTFVTLCSTLRQNGA